MISCVVALGVAALLIPTLGWQILRRAVCPASTVLLALAGHGCGPGTPWTEPPMRGTSWRAARGGDGAVPDESGCLAEPLARGTIRAVLARRVRVSPAD